MIRGRRVCADLSIALAFGATVHYIGAISKHEHPAPGSPGPRHKGRHMFIARAAVAAAAIAAPLAFAAPAMAQDGMNFQCAPCVADVNNDGVTNPIWNELTSFGPWERIFDPAGDGQGVWETGVQAVNGGAWEKVFPSEPIAPPETPTP